MPAISLVVCVHLQRDFLERLLRESQNCYDDLVVEHDIPDTQNAREVVEAAGGRFFERSPTASQEPHWPFMWAQARYDWILRLDADEFPSGKMKMWLREFRRAPEPPPGISGYTCIWPLWNGRRTLTKRWPAGRLFLFDRRKVRFFGMGELSPIPDGSCTPLDIILCHQPYRKSYGVWNAATSHPRGRAFIAQALLGKPTDLNCWRWENGEWPLGWEQLRRRPLWTCVKRFIKNLILAPCEQWRAERRFFPSAVISGPAHDALIGLEYWLLKRKQKS